MSEDRGPTRWRLGVREAEPSLPEMIGQMILVSFPGTRPGEEGPARVVSMIRDGRIGGVVLLYDNIVGPAQVRALNTAFARADRRLPPFICVDQEGGTVKRLTPARGFVGLPGAAKIASLPLDKAYEFDERAANELAELGFNVNFGPVVDLNTNPLNPIIGLRGRAYAAEPERVIAYARQFIDAHEQAGILTVAKHFPGHGSSATDPHIGIVDVSKTWREDELIPYVHLIDGGLIDMIMVGHLIAPDFSDGGDTPASLSERAIKGQLRARLGFRGLVVTDDLDMAAIRKRYSTEQAAVLAIAAGADLIIVANQDRADRTTVDRIIGAVVAAVADGRISRAQIRQAYDLIVTAKRRLGAIPAR